MADITSANSVLAIGVNSVFPQAQILQGFAQDDAYTMPSVETTENRMGVDGIKSAGWIPQLKEMEIILQPDSPSISFFESWYAAQEAARDILVAFGSIDQPAIGRTYVLTNGTLKNYSPFATAKKVLEPRRFSIVFQAALGAPIPTA